MRIYNISKENSLKSLVFDLVFISFMTLVPLIACIFDLNIYTFAGLFTMIIIDILFVTNLFYKRHEYLKTKSIHKILYYVDFEPTYLRICAKNHKNQEKFINYDYSKIKGANIILDTFDTSTTRRHYTGIRDISVNFYTEDDEVYILHSYHLTFGGNLRTIYNIISFCRKMKNFTYTLTGTGDQSEIKEKLDYYIKHNRKLHVNQAEEKI